MTSRRPHRIDWLIAAAIGAITFFEMVGVENRQGPLWLNLLSLAAIAFGLAWRRPHPVAASLFCFALIVVMNIWLTTVEHAIYAFFPLFLCSYASGAYGDGRGWRIVVPVAVLVVAILNVVQNTTAVGDFLFPTSMGCLAAVAGHVVRSRTELAAELHEAAVRAEEAQAEAEAHAVAEERRRIAREMHDVVAHSMSVMVVQAGGARRILDRDPARAAEAARLIERTGREALAEMRRLLGVLRPGEAERSPQPGLDGLDGLVRRAREAGLPVELELVGERPELSPGLELAAFRILQEGLTNALKHAGSTPTRVGVRYGDDGIELLIENAAPAAPALNGVSGGHGLVGMRERVKLFGGELEAGELPGGGFRVRALLPREVNA